MKFKFLLITLIPYTFFAQQILVTAGGTDTNANLNTSYTIGQLSFVTQTGSIGDAISNIHFPVERRTLSLDETTNSEINIGVFPIPANEYFTIRVDSYQLIDDLEYTLYDKMGRMLLQNKIRGHKTEVSVDNLSPAIYILQLEDAKHKKRTFKLIIN